MELERSCKFKKRFERSVLDPEIARQNDFCIRQRRFDVMK